MHMGAGFHRRGRRSEANAKVRVVFFSNAKAGINARSGDSPREYMMGDLRRYHKVGKPPITHQWGIHPLPQGGRRPAVARSRGTSPISPLDGDPPPLLQTRRKLAPYPQGEIFPARCHNEGAYSVSQKVGHLFLLPQQGRSSLLRAFPPTKTWPPLPQRGRYFPLPPGEGVQEGGLPQVVTASEVPLRAVRGDIQRSPCVSVETPTK